VAHNEIGTPTFAIEFISCHSSRFGSNQFGFGILGPGVGIEAGAPAGLPLLQYNSLASVGQTFLSLPEGLHAMVALKQGRCEVFELPGEVLMNKEDVQPFHLTDAGA
jgi:hypothetical protein